VKKVYLKYELQLTPDVENKISLRSLNNGTTRIGGIDGFWPGMDSVFRFEFLEGGSEKGNTRKHTEKWVTSWSFMFWRNLAFLR
jgi:hypothetical protein